jgi:serine/threonine protein phosphatase PrpC
VTTTTPTAPEPTAPQPPPVEQQLAIETPFGRPVHWADVAVVTDIGDSHELNDDRCLVLTSTDLGDRAAASTDFMLCLLADGATGSTFGSSASVRHQSSAPRHAGWRASQLAQGAFVESFLNSTDVDILDRLKDGLRAADRALIGSSEGTLSTTLVALYVGADGTAYAASIGDSVLLVLPPRRKTPGDRRLKKLGYEDSTSVGSGDTTLSSIAEGDCIEQWWPHKEGGGTTTRVEPGTYMVLMSDGISDNLPADFIDQLLHRHPLDRATVGLPAHTRERRVETQKRSGGSTKQLGLDNMSAIVVRFDGQRRLGSPPRTAHADDASLVTVVGTHGGPTPDAGGQFGLICRASRDSGSTLVPSFLRQFIESEHQGEAGVEARLAAAFLNATPHGQTSSRSHFAVLAVDYQGQSHTFSSGGAGVGPGSDLPARIAARVVPAARETAVQRMLRNPSIWGPAIAALAIFVLVSTAFATGTVRPAPPPAPTSRPGEPRPTPDTRPSLSLGGFVLQPPVQATPVPVSPAPAQVQDAQASADQSQDPDSQPDGTNAEPEPTEAACTNFLGIGCQAPVPPAAPAPPVRPAQPAPAPLNRVLPVPSPAALVDDSLDDLQAANSAPPRGSRLETALQGASVADQNFATEIDRGSRELVQRSP